MGSTLALSRSMVNPKCRRCGKTGLVRSERVITGQRATTVFYCGACGHSWEQQDPPTHTTQSKSGNNR